MGQENYQAERIWLCAYFDDCDDISLRPEAETSMITEGISLAEIIHLFRDAQVVWAERDHEGCIFTVKGRNCDDEEITVVGGFNSEMQIVSVFDVKKT